MSALPSLRVRLPYPHPGQRIVRSEARRFNWLAAGRRWRKTTLVMAIAVEAAMRGARIIWGAPVFDQVRVGWAETRRAAYEVAEFNSSRMTASFLGGGAIIFRSLDNPDNARSHTADGVVIDECGDVHPDAWHEVLRPMLIDTNGWAWGIGSAKGRNWFFEEYVKAKDATDSRSWQAPTLGVRIEAARLVREPHPLENPNIPFPEIEHLFETMPELSFRQEVLSEFNLAEGVVFRNIAACSTAPLDASPVAHKGHFVVMGGDWGRQHDFTALSVFCATCMTELALDRFNQIGWALQRGRLEALGRRWGVKYYLLEENSIGGPNIEALQSEGLEVAAFNTNQVTKPQVIQSLALALERREAQWLDVDYARAELEAYEQKISAATGRVSYGAPAGLFDDTVIARALALRAALLGAPAIGSDVVGAFVGTR